MAAARAPRLRGDAERHGHGDRRVDAGGISGTGGGGSTFTQSYTVNRETKVIAVGAGTAAAAGGGGVAVTSVVGVGDQVQVTYRPAGATLQAEQVRVTAKKK